MDTQNTTAATTTTTTTATATTEAPTLAELLAARAEQRAEQERENARREQLSREQDRSEALDYISSWMRAHISPDLAEALRMIPTVDDSRLEDDDDDYRGIALAGFLQLDLRGAGVDDSSAPEEARRDPSGDERWTIIREYYHGYSWTLRGPNGYRAHLGEVYSTDESLDTVILDAIAAYPAWLADADARSAQQAEQERRKREQERQQAEQSATPRRYSSIAGGRRGGMLDRGNRIELSAFNPWAENGFLRFAATVVDYRSGEWLLLNVGTRQRLIPVAQVIEIHPLPDLAPTVEDEPDGAADPDASARE